MHTVAGDRTVEKHRATNRFLASRLILILGCLILLLSGLTALFAGIEQDDADETSAPGRQNSLLREHFRLQYLRSEMPGSLPPSERFVEAYVDRQIDYFLESVRLDVARLKSDLAVAQKLHKRVLEIRKTANEPVLVEAKEAFKATMDSIVDAADDLGDRLAIVFVNLDSKEKLKKTVNEDSLASFFFEELLFLENQILGAERLINDYLFIQTNTVRIEDLKGDGMLLRLYWAEEMAKAIKKQVR